MVGTEVSHGDDMLTGLFTIEPGGSTAVAEEPGGRGIKIIVAAVLLGLCASAWIAVLSLGATSDDGDFACVEDVRGGACAASRPIPVELRDRFDNYGANSPGE